MNISNITEVPETSLLETTISFELVLHSNDTSSTAVVFSNEQQRYISPFAQLLITSVYVFGFSANACSLALLRRSESARNQKLILMVRCLVANDMMALCSSFLLVYMRLYLEPDFLATRWFCGLRVLTRFFGFSSGSVASVMAVERCVALTRPFFYQKVSMSIQFHYYLKFLFHFRKPRERTFERTFEPFSISPQLR